MKYSTIKASIYLHEFNSQALILGDGTVLIQLKLGIYFTEHQFLNDPEFSHMNKDFKESRIKAFREVMEYAVKSCLLT